MGFLGNFVKVFPDLATRPLYIIDVSYAGMFIVRLVLSCVQADRYNVTPGLHHEDLLRDG